MAGLRAATFDEAWAACIAVRADDLRGDCTSAIIERFGAYDHCPEVPEGRWRDECLFKAAEVQARRGNVRGALESCQPGAYAEQCNDHVLGIWAMGMVERPVAEVGEGIDGLRAVIVAPRAISQAWRSYFRNRIVRGLEIDTRDCPDKDCRIAAQLEVGAAVRELQRQTGDAVFCAAEPPELGWAQAEATRRWVREQADRGCATGGPNAFVGPNGEAAPPPLSPGGTPLGGGPSKPR